MEIFNSSQCNIAMQSIHYLTICSYDCVQQVMQQIQLFHTIQQCCVVCVYMC